MVLKKATGVQKIQTHLPQDGQNVLTTPKGNKAFPQGYQGVEYQNLARVKEPPKQQEKVELTDPKDLPI